jgi:hypothetical protein
VSQEPTPPFPDAPGRNRWVQPTLHLTSENSLPNMSWADELLGFAHPLQAPNGHSVGDRRSLESEIQAYFLDTQIGTSTMQFWQVCVRTSGIVFQI